MATLPDSTWIDLFDVGKYSRNDRWRPPDGLRQGRGQASEDVAYRYTVEFNISGLLGNERIFYFGRTIHRTNDSYCRSTANDKT